MLAKGVLGSHWLLLLYIVSSISADDLAQQGAKSSAAVILTLNVRDGVNSV